MDFRWETLAAPIALLYVTYDEHAYIMNKQIRNNDKEITLKIRFADDILSLYATTANNMDRLRQTTYNDITKNIYEHDIDNKSLNIIQDDKSKNKYLDTDIIINKNNIKLFITIKIKT